jgi:hypothetical protein
LKEVSCGMIVARLPPIMVIDPIDGGPVPCGRTTKAEADDEEGVPEGGGETDDRQTRADSGKGDRGGAGADAPEADFDPDGILLSIAHWWLCS